MQIGPKCRYQKCIYAKKICNFFEAETLGHLVERANVYVKLHLCKDGTPVNAEAESNIVSNIMIC